MEYINKNIMGDKITKLRNKVIISGIGLLLFHALFFVICLVLFVLSIGHILSFPLWLAITLYVLAVGSLPIAIVTTIMSIVAINSARMITTMRNIAVIGTWILLWSPIAWWLRTSLKALSTSAIQYKNDDYVVISLKELIAIQRGSLWQQVRSAQRQMESDNQVQEK